MKRSCSSSVSRQRSWSIGSRSTAKDDQPIQTDDATYPPDQWAFRQEYPLSR